MGCSACAKKKKNSLLYGANSIDCPNKRNKLKELKKTALIKANSTIDLTRKEYLLTTATEIANLLTNSKFCPSNEFIQTLKDSINGE